MRTSAELPFSSFTVGGTARLTIDSGRTRISGISHEVRDVGPQGEREQGPCHLNSGTMSHDDPYLLGEDTEILRDSVMRLETKALIMLSHLPLPLEGDTGLSRRCCCFLLPNITDSEGVQPSHRRQFYKLKAFKPQPGTGKRGLEPPLQMEGPGVSSVCGASVAPQNGSGLSLHISLIIVS